MAEAGANLPLLLRGMEELAQTNDMLGTLSIADRVLEMDPQNARALDFRQQARQALLDGYLATLAPLARIPRLNPEVEPLDRSRLDRHARIVLARIDGRRPLKDVLLLSGIPRFEAAGTLLILLRAGIITITDGIEAAPDLVDEYEEPPDTDPGGRQ
jgi:hypothetical protein